MSRISKAALAVAALSLGGALAGCGGGSASDAGASPAADADRPAAALPQSGRVGTTVLFDAFSSQLLTYDTTRKVEVERGTKAGYSQYAFSPRTDLFTSGDQNGKDFSVLRVDGDQIETVAKLDGRRGIFPLAADDDTTLFEIRTYDEVGKDIGETSIASLGDDGKLTTSSSSLAAETAAIVGDDLYITVADGDEYTLYRQPVADLKARPERVDGGLESDAIFAHDGALLRHEKGRVVGKDRSYACPASDLCEFHDDQDLFVSLALAEDSSLTLTATDTGTGKELAKVTGAIDFAVEDGELTVYREAEIKKIPLGGPS